MAGRRPKPTKLKLLQGNPGKRKLNEAAPEPEVCVPDPPEHLSDAAREHWQQVAAELAEAGILTRIDVDALGLYCEAYGRWVHANRQIQEFGPLVKAPSGYPMQSPFLAIANKAFDQMGDVDRVRNDAQLEDQGAGRAPRHRRPNGRLPPPRRRAVGQEERLMPYAPPSPCAEPGCPRLTHAARCEEHTREQRRLYRATPDRKAAKAFYASARWQRVRRMKLSENPFCEVDECDELAGDVHHLKPWQKFPDLAFAIDNLESL